MAIGKHNSYTEYHKCIIGLVYIEPILPVVEVNDDLTARTSKLVSLFIKSDIMNSWRGCHRCSCGKMSDNRDHFFTPLGKSKPTHITHSLLLHYVQFHRHEIPQDDMDELMSVLSMANL